jgi:hypothetical protein
MRVLVLNGPFEEARPAPPEDAESRNRHYFLEYPSFPTPSSTEVLPPTANRYPADSRNTAIRRTTCFRTNGALRVHQSEQEARTPAASIP